MTRKQGSRVRSVRRVVAWTIPFVLLATVGQSLMMGGATLHYYIGDVAKRMLDDDNPLRELLDDRSNAFKMGLVFPDLMHGVRTERKDREGKGLLERNFEKDAASYAHTPAFLTAYAQKIFEYQQQPDAQQIEVDRMKAHLLGAVGHVVADLNMDNRLLPRVRAGCYTEDDDLTVESKIMVNNGGFATAAQHFTDQILDNAVFETLPPTEEFRESRKIKDPKTAIGEGINKRRERRERRRKSSANKDDRGQLWDRIRPNSAYIPAELLAEILIASGKVASEDGLEGRMTETAESQKSSKVKARPGSVRAKRAYRVAVEKECPDVMDYDSDEGWYFGAGGVDETAEILAEFMQAIWDVWESGQAPVFFAGPCRVHKGAHKNPKLDERGQWTWLHKHLCMEWSAVPVATPGQPGVGVDGGTAAPLEHCMYPAGFPTMAEGSEGSAPSNNDCGASATDE